MTSSPVNDYVVLVRPSASKGGVYYSEHTPRETVLAPSPSIRTSDHRHMSESKEESKDAPREGTTSSTDPYELRLPAHKGFELLTTPPSSILSSMKSSLKSTLRVVLGSSVAITANGTGFVNAVLAVNNVAAISEFASYSAIYGEFFVKTMEVMYQPQSINGTWPATAVGAAGQPLAVVSLHHGLPAPATIGLAASNGSLEYAHTNSAWKYKWKNIEDSSSRVVISPVSASAIPTQGWCLTDGTSAAAYTGKVLFLSPVNIGTTASMQLGNFLIRFEVLFRNRT